MEKVEDYFKNFPIFSDLSDEARNQIKLRRLEIEKNNYEGFYTRPMSWERVCEKFENLAQPYANQDLRRRIIDTVQGLENNTVTDLTELIAQVRIPDH